MIRTRMLWTLFAVMVIGALLAGCAAKQQETQQTPQPMIDSTAIKAAEQAQADSLAREKAKADSIAMVQEQERRRIEAERIAAQQKAAEEMAAKESLQTIYFNFDKSNLSQASRDALQSNAELLRKWADWQVIVEGHCDERGSTEYNLALGERRAASVKKYYTDYGIDPTRIEVISYGEERPVADGHNEKAWSQNRRAVTTVK